MSTSAPLSLVEKLIKFEPLYKYVVQGGIVGLGYWKYDRSTQDLALFVGHQFVLMEQQGKHIKDISDTQKEVLRMLKAAEQKEKNDQKD